MFGFYSNKNKKSRSHWDKKRDTFPDRYQKTVVSITDADMKIGETSLERKKDHGYWTESQVGSKSSMHLKRDIDESSDKILPSLLSDIKQLKNDVSYLTKRIEETNLNNNHINHIIMRLNMLENKVDKIDENYEIEELEEIIEELNEPVNELKEDMIDEPIEEDIEELNEPVNELKEDTIDEPIEEIIEELNESVNELKEDTIDESIEEDIKETIIELVKEDIEDVNGSVNKIIGCGEYLQGEDGCKGVEGDEIIGHNGIDEEVIKLDNK